MSKHPNRRRIPPIPDCCWFRTLAAGDHSPDAAARAARLQREARGGPRRRPRRADRGVQADEPGLRGHRARGARPRRRPGADRSGRLRGRRPRRDGRDAHLQHARGDAQVCRPFRARAARALRLGQPRLLHARPALRAAAGRPALAHRRHVRGREGQPLRVPCDLSGLRLRDARRPRRSRAGRTTSHRRSISTRSRSSNTC